MPEGSHFSTSRCQQKLAMDFDRAPNASAAVEGAAIFTKFLGTNPRHLRVLDALMSSRQGLMRKALDCIAGSSRGLGVPCERVPAGTATAEFAAPLATVSPTTAPRISSRWNCNLRRSFY